MMTPPGRKIGVFFVLALFDRPKPLMHALTCAQIERQRATNRNEVMSRPEPMVFSHSRCRFWWEVISKGDLMKSRSVLITVKANWVWKQAEHGGGRRRWWLLPRNQWRCWRQRSLGPTKMQSDILKGFVRHRLLRIRLTHFSTAAHVYVGHVDHGKAYVHNYYYLSPRSWQRLLRTRNDFSTPIWVWGFSDTRSLGYLVTWLLAHIVCQS